MVFLSTLLELCLILEVYDLEGTNMQRMIIWVKEFQTELKILPSSHSTATWCIMVYVSMWFLPTTAHTEWCARYYYRNDKESYTFQRQNPFILLHDVHTNIS